MWANVADSECRSLSLPASCDLGIDRRQLHRISIRARLGPHELELLLSRFALIPAQYSQAAAYGGEASTLSDYLPFGTYMFLHGGWLHLILNMWICGCSVRPSRIGWVTRGISCSILPAAGPRR